MDVKSLAEWVLGGEYPNDEGMIICSPNGLLGLPLEREF